VLALDCSPGRYPAERGLDHLSQHLKWSPNILTPAYEFIDQYLPRPFIAIHFRHAFAQAGCGFSVGQCNDYELPAGSAGSAAGLDESRVCTPDVDEMRSHLQKVMTAFSKGEGEGEGEGIRSLFIASDRQFGNDVMSMFREVVSPNVAWLPTGLNEVEGGATPGGGGSPQIDLAILTLADHSVLHCPSSFSNVAKRLRDYPNEYYATATSTTSSGSGSSSSSDEPPPQVYSSTSFWGVDSSLPGGGGGGGGGGGDQKEL
jgi:hypothetical protein